LNLFGESNNFKKVFYKGLQTQGHVIKYIPFDSGISKSRYVLKDICKEPYLVFMEDDFEATENTNLYKLQNILEENSHIGVVGGNLAGYAKTGAYSFFLDYADDKICYFPLDYLVEKNLAKWKQTSTGIPFLEATIVSDFTMWKKEVPNIFDENVKTIEHTHVYLLVKYKTKYKVAFCPASEIKHVHDRSNNNYTNFRNRKEDVDYLKKYWEIVDFYKFDKRVLHGLEQPLVNAIDPIDVSKTVYPTKSEDKLIVKKEIIINTNSEQKVYDTDVVFEKFKSNFIDYIIIKETCLNVIFKKELNNIQICIPNKQQLDLINTLFPNHNFYIEIKTFKNTKKIKYKNFDINVPCPVVKYLESEFHKSWEELKNE
jgi:hypothetical protein